MPKRVDAVALRGSLPPETLPGRVGIVAGRSRGSTRKEEGKGRWERGTSQRAKWSGQSGAPHGCTPSSAPGDMQVRVGV